MAPVKKNRSLDICKICFQLCKFDSQTFIKNWMAIFSEFRELINFVFLYFNYYSAQLFVSCFLGDSKSLNGPKNVMN